MGTVIAGDSAYFFAVPGSGLWHVLSIADPSNITIESFSLEATEDAERTILAAGNIICLLVDERLLALNFSDHTSPL